MAETNASNYIQRPRLIKPIWTETSSGVDRQSFETTGQPAINHIRSMERCTVSGAGQHD